MSVINTIDSLGLSEEELAILRGALKFPELRNRLFKVISLFHNGKKLRMDIKPEYSIEEIIAGLKVEYKDEYEKKVKEFNTFLKQDQVRWGKGARYSFEESLVKEGTKYFTYIKLYIDENGELIGLTAGESASKKINKKTDLSFSIKREHGPARCFIDDYDLDWCQTKILVFPANSKCEARKIEYDLRKMFSLHGS